MSNIVYFKIFLYIYICIYIRIHFGSSPSSLSSLFAFSCPLQIVKVSGGAKFDCRRSRLVLVFCWPLSYSAPALRWRYCSLSRVCHSPIQGGGNGRLLALHLAGLVATTAELTSSLSHMLRPPRRSSSLQTGLMHLVRWLFACHVLVRI